MVENGNITVRNVMKARMADGFNGFSWCYVYSLYNNGIVYIFRKKNVRWSVVEIWMLIYIVILLIMAVVNIVIT